MGPLFEITSQSFVPEGRCDRSLARSAWASATPKEPSRRVRCDSRRCVYRMRTFSCFFFWEPDLTPKPEFIPPPNRNRTRPRPRVLFPDVNVRISQLRLVISALSAKIEIEDEDEFEFDYDRMAKSNITNVLMRYAHLPDHPVPSGTVLSRDAFPGTSCQATIGVVPPGRACRHFATATI